MRHLRTQAHWKAKLYASRAVSKSCANVIVESAS
nr:MAG TPA: hypothetical protein [Bacteriophage sp.]